MQRFQHNGVAECRIEFDRAPSGGSAACRMIVEASIPLARWEPGFDQEAVSALELAAVEYVRARGIGSLIFTRRY